MPNRSTTCGKRKSFPAEEQVVSKCIKLDVASTETKLSDSKPDMELSLNSIQRAFHLKVPKEFTIFYEFCKSLDQNAPLEALFQPLNLRLVGPFEVLHQQGNLAKDIDEIPMCYRYFHDPPELVTVMTSSNGWHLGYFRDYPSEESSLLVESKPNQCGTLKVLGTSLFAVIKSLAQKQGSCKHILSEIDQFLIVSKFALPNTDAVIKERKKRCVCSTLNEIGLVVPLHGDIGYRPLTVTYTKLASILQSALSATDEDEQLTRLEKIDELITFAQFACDEGDFGQAIELGLSMLAFHPKGIPLEKANVLNSRIKHLLSVGYELAGRPEFARVIVQHMHNRRIDPPRFVVES